VQKLIPSTGGRKLELGGDFITVENWAAQSRGLLIIAGNCKLTAITHPAFNHEYTQKSNQHTQPNSLAIAAHDIYYSFSHCIALLSDKSAGTRVC
jgi:hypothetical protein